jgi:hypothetical protein
VQPGRMPLRTGKAWRRLHLCMAGVLFCVGLPSAHARQSHEGKQTAAQKSKAAVDKKQSASPSGLPAINTPFPAFTLPDTEGKTHALAELKGRPVALFFFCGCERCQRCALTWAQLQQGGALAALPAAPANVAAATSASDAPNTVIIFMGDAEATRAFAATAGLDSKQTLLLPDPKLTLTQRVHALPCPRTFALDGKGIVRYVNAHKDDDPLKASAATIVTRTLEALTNTVQPQSQPQRRNGTQ